MFDHFTLLHFYFILGSLAIILPIAYGFISDYKRDHKLLISAAIIVFITVTLFFISDYVLELISIFK